jgi:cyclophilin family peptidyl-prolyl cis-trans isomerase
MSSPKSIPEPQTQNKTIPLIFAIACLIGIPSFFVYSLNVAYNNTDTQKSINTEKEKEQKSKETEVKLNQKLDDENKNLGYETKLKNSVPDENFGKFKNEHWVSDWKTNQGDLKIHLHANDAPKTVENFVRLVDRKVFENSTSHRIVKQENFGVFQAGDFDKGNGQGGQSAFWISELKPNTIPDELWKVAPTVDNEKGTATGGEFRNPKYYVDYDSQTGLVKYPKGLILMAKTQQPDSASSQFFVTFKDTILPAQYTVFGKIDEASFGTLDKIGQIDPVEVTADPTTGEEKQNKVEDGKPGQEIKIEKTEVKVSEGHSK